MVAPVSLATWEAETRGLQGQDQPSNLAKLSQNKDWGCSSEVEFLPHMTKAPVLQKQNQIIK